MPMLATYVACGGGYAPAIVYQGTWFANYQTVFEDIEAALAEAIAWAAQIRENMRQ